MLYDHNFKANHPLSFELFWRELSEKSNLISNGGDLKCHVCQGLFANEIVLYDHVQKFHTDNKALRSAKYAVNFAPNKGLSSHIPTIHEEKKMKCQICNASFLKETLLKEHTTEFHEKSNKRDDKVTGSKI